MIAEALRWYRGRRVLVSGHTGFKGAWLSAWLQVLGAEVTGYALAPKTQSLFADAALAKGMISILGDVRDRSALGAAIDAARPEIILHLAAQSLVRRSYVAPLETFDTNVLGTANLLDAARTVPSLRAVVVVTSDKCYENDGRATGYTETAPMGGHDPYSASKGCAELVTTAFARSYFSDGGCVLASARAGNVLGGGDWAEDRIVPDLVRAVMSGSPAVIRRPDAVRPWQHVLEPLSGYLLLGYRAANEGRRFAGGWNFGPAIEDAVDVRTLVEALRGRWSDIAVDYVDAVSGPHEAALLRLDCCKARERLGWRPRLDLDGAAAMTADWYRAVLAEPASIADVTYRQISDYAALPVRHERELCA